MLTEKDLPKPNKQGMNTIDKMLKLALHLYTGNQIEFNGFTYKMDGCCNPYIVGYAYSKSDNDNVPIFQNENFWDTLYTIAESITDEEYKAIKLGVARTLVLSTN